MRRIAILLAVLVLAILAIFPSAVAYQRIGHDPAGDASSFPDIRSSILRVEQGTHGRVLVLVVRADENFGTGWVVVAFLDTKEGKAYDRVVDMYGSGCKVYTRRGYERFKALAEGAFRQGGDEIRCRLPIGHFDPTKPIRWSVVSQEGGDPTAGSDRAPDQGMYG